jgi:hypothetical protein
MAQLRHSGYNADATWENFMAVRCGQALLFENYKALTLRER